MKTRTALLAGIAAGALLSSPAFAQDQTGDDVTVSADIPPASVSAIPENVIIITARRRAEASQDVPLAIATLDGRTINETGAFSVQKIQSLAPSLQVYSSNPSPLTSATASDDVPPPALGPSGRQRVGPFGAPWQYTPCPRT